MTRAAAVALAAAFALVVAGPAQAATLSLTGAKRCYRAGDSLTVTGSGFTPGGQTDIALDGRPLGPVFPDGAGNFSVPLRIGSLSGVRQRTVVATDAANAANVAQAQFLGSALGVTVKPRNGAAGRRLRISATGFTTGKRLYAHIVRKRYRRNVLVGKLKGPCHTLKKRKRIMPGSTPAGRYVVQFDTRRRYSKTTKVWVRFDVTVSRG